MHERRVKLKPKKCRLLKREVDYLRQLVSAAGYRLNHSNVEAVRTLKKNKPSTAGEVRRSLGLLGATAGIPRTLLGLPTHSSSYCRQFSEDVAKST